VKLKKLAQIISLICIAAPAYAQVAAPEVKKDAPKPQKVERIEVTGSSIKRVADEGALPLQIITKEEIDKAGITSAEQLIATISANGTGRDNMSANTGIINTGITDRNNNGNSSANLRGLGSSSTLVLLNGRRVSTHGAKGNSVDLNSIPLAAVSRVEILKDGASAVYGTDAIGGVINFILRKDFSGVELTAFTDVTHDGGGNITRGNILAGTGDLARDGYNVMATYTLDRQERLKGSQRDFVNGQQPNRGLTPDTGGLTFATLNAAAGTAFTAAFNGSPTIGNFTLPVSTVSFNRANLLSFQNNCESIKDGFQYRADVLGADFYRAARGCAYDYGKQQVLIQPVDRQNLVARGIMALNADTNIVAEAVASRTESTRSFEPVQLTASVGNANLYPVSGPYYKLILPIAQFIPTFNPNLPLAYRWRCGACGNREINSISQASRVMVGIEGILAGKYDYRVSASTAGSRAGSTLINGYYNQVALYQVMASGVLNPFLRNGESQTPEAMAALAGASANGRSLFGGEASLTQFDGTLSGEVFQLPAGPVAAAVGFDMRRESYLFRNDATTVVINGAPFDDTQPKVSRTIKAAYAEVVIPVIKNLEITGAVRNDRYSDFGGTTNPKASIRFNPIPQLLFRGSYSEGFRAPSFFQLYTAGGPSPLPRDISDPVLCATFSTANQNCGIRVDQINGGNRDLKPEKSKQSTIGVVFSPVNWATISIDAWNLKRTERIYELNALDILANAGSFPEAFIRRADGTLSAIRAGYVNAEGDKAKGIEVGLNANGNMMNGKWSAGLDGTLMRSFKSKVLPSDPELELVGEWNTRDLFVRWKHSARFTYSQGPWSSTLSQSYTAGYKDENLIDRKFAPDFKERVEAYVVYNLSATYTGFKGLTITGGIKNIFNTDPPFTAHNVDFAGGTAWDPRVADPRGRAYTIRLNYKF
jgi:iron complex outermembrane recepter protein